MLFFVCCISCAADSQQTVAYMPMEGIATLPDELNETSGIVIASDSSYFVHNDSGKKPRIYEISNRSGNIVHETRFHDLKNHDWEEIARDENNLYIGDFGNNLGTRDNLKIYIIPLNRMHEDEVEEISVLKFTYPGYKASGGRHNFDCEAMIAAGDSLYLFSKNRGDLGTDVYRLPKTAGNEVAVKGKHFDTQGLITSADYRGGEHPQLVLLGYRIEGGQYRSFLWRFTGFQGMDFFGGTATRMEISSNLQAEAILLESDSTVIITTEEERKGKGKINRLLLDQ
jgi:hypothetical protein